MMRQVWRDELDSHLLDCADELLKLGYDREAALSEAKQRFGDAEQIARDLQQLHPWLAVYADWIVLGLLLLSCIPLYALHYLAASTTLGFASDYALLWWFGGALVMVTLVMLRWQIAIVPLTKRTGVCIALSLGLFVATLITIALDINNFETIIYNALLGLLTAALVFVSWQWSTLRQRQISVAVIIAVMIIFAWREEGLGENQLFNHCLYLVDQNPYAAPPASCEHVSWLSFYAVFMYASAALVMGYLGYYLIQLWKRGAHLSHKVITTTALVLLPLTAVQISGVNSLGALDVVAWKRDIYQAYVDILGRRPEEKDYEFYGTTRAYEHLSEVKAVLYQSAERKEKIKLLYQELLQREPTAEELQHYADSTLTINAIRHELSNELEQ
jgi:hypothetical protein